MRRGRFCESSIFCRPSSGRRPHERVELELNVSLAAAKRSLSWAWKLSNACLIEGMETNDDKACI
jgi:hypothetical protein